MEQRLRSGSGLTGTTAWHSVRTQTSAERHRSSGLLGADVAALAGRQRVEGVGPVAGLTGTASGLLREELWPPLSLLCVVQLQMLSLI